MPEKTKIRSKRNISITIIAVIALIAVVCCTGFGFFRYSQEMLYKESVSQLEELCSQLLEKLNMQIDTQWNYVDKFAESCENESTTTADDLSEIITDYQKHLSMQEHEVLFRAIDEDGCYYTSNGKNGQWTGLDKLDMDADRQICIIANWLDNTSYMAFAVKTAGDLTVDGKKITHYVLLTSMEDMQKYFHSSAFGEQNKVYVIDINGRILFEDGSIDGIMFEGTNVFQSLENATYPHKGSLEETVTEAWENGTVCTDLVIGGQNFYMLYDSMPEYYWGMLFLVSSDEVATSTSEMVSAVLRMVVILVAFMVTAVIATFALLSRFLYNKKALKLKIESEERLEAANRVLEDTNNKLEQSYKVTEDALETAQKATKAKSSFLANMSHDIRTPMNAIVGLTKLMEGDIDDKQKMHYYIQKLEHSSNYMLGLINDILDMSKIESGEVHLNQEPLKMAEQAGQIESIIRSQSAEKNQDFKVSVHKVTHEYLIGDSIRVRQIFINLLNNAVKYTQAGGSIRFEIKEVPCDKEGYATILTSVIDNGSGMSPEYLQHIFEPFTREESSVTNKIQGTGLGMSITKSLVDLMGGEISVESELGKGSRFDVLLTLPIDTDSENGADVSSVLLISDDENLTANVEASLKDKSVGFASAADIEKAAAMLDEERPEVIILSGYLKDANLTDIVKRLREKAGEDVIILCSDYAHKNLVKNLIMESRVDGFIPRPFFFENFKCAIENARTKDDNDSERRAALGGRRFLCAEDNELNAEILDALLTMHGASCVIYPSGVELVEAFADVREGDFDAILMDVQMPKMDGMQATRAIRSSDNPLGKDIPIIAMTANAFSSDVQECLEAGMDAHLAKPVDIASLERTLHEVIAKKSGGGKKA